MAGRRRPMSGAIIRKVMTGGRVTLLLVALAALPVGGCGADVAYTRAPDRRVEVRLDEYRVLPEHIEVRAGRVTLVAHNDGRLTHNLAVVQFDAPGGRRAGEGLRRPDQDALPGRDRPDDGRPQARQVPPGLHDRQPRQPRPVRRAQGGPLEVATAGDVSVDGTLPRGRIGPARQRFFWGGARHRPGCRRFETVAI